MKTDNDLIAIVGIGMRVPEADDTESFWKILEAKRDMTKDIPKERFNTDYWCSKEKVKGSSISFRGGFIDNIRDFDAPFFNLSANEARELDPQIRLLLECGWYAIEDAGVVLQEGKNNGGVFIGHMTHDYMEILSSNRFTINSHCMQGNAETMAANRLSYFFNLTGPSVTVNTACSSSLVAVHDAVRAIQTGECEWAIAGGANCLLDPRYFVGFTDWGTMSPDGHSFSFDSRANGYVRSEGAGIVVLKTVTAAHADGDRIYAVIRGCGVNHDGNKSAITIPRGLTQQHLLEKVCRESETDPKTVAYVEAHGTGTVAGDKTEAAAISAALCKDKRNSPLLIGSLKSNFGHMEGAAGITSLIKGALSVYKGRIPASIKIITPNPAILWNEWQLRVPRETEMFPEDTLDCRRVVVSSFGIGGTNSCFILEESHMMQTPLPICGKDHIFSLMWSAKTETALKAVARQLLDQWKIEKDPAVLESICWTMVNHRTPLAERAAVVGPYDTILKSLESFTSGDLSPDLIRSAALEDGIRPAVFVFCGQGAQWIGMGCDCLRQFPIFAQRMQECCDIVKRLGGWDLMEKINCDEVNSTRVSQPATTAVQISLVDQLAAWGIHASGAVGHSSGEIAAAYTAGAVTFEEAIELAYYRGSTIAECSTEHCGMAAVGLTAEALQPYLVPFDKLTIACYNSSNALTVSGDGIQLDALCEILKKDGCFCRRLKVTHAFHSPYMAPAMPVYEKLISHITGKQQLRCQLFSSLRGCELTDGSELNASYFVANLTKPVRFPEALEALGKALPQAVILEIGPHPTLQRPIQQCLTSHEGIKTRTLGTLDRRIDGFTAIEKCIAGLACCGSDYTYAFNILHPCCFRYDRLSHYPFERKTLWYESEYSYRFRCAQMDHPVLGVRQMTPLPTWECEFEMEKNKWVQDHVISGSCLAPGALYLDTAIAAGCLVFESDDINLSDCCFIQALLLPSKGHVTIRTTVDPDSGEVMIYHREVPDDVTKSFVEKEMLRWTLHFRCFARPETEKWLEKEKEQVMERARSNCTSDVNTNTMYYRMNKQGLQFGQEFQTMSTMKVGLEEGICNIRDDALGVDAVSRGNFMVHPVLLDVIFQCLIGVLGDSVGNCIPTAIHSLNFCKAAVHEEGHLSACVRRCHRKGMSHAGDVWLMRGDTTCVWCSGVQVVPLARANKDNSKLLSTIQWIETPMPEPRENPDFMILPGASDSLQHELEHSGQLINIDSIKELKNDDQLNAQQRAAAWVWILDMKMDSMVSIYQQSVYPLIRLLIHCCQQHISIPALLVVIRGASMESSCPGNTSLIGLMRTLHTECPTLSLCVLDLDVTSTVSEQTAVICSYVGSKIDGYKEITVRGGYCYSPQVVPFIPLKTLSYREPEDNTWRVHQAQEGSLDSFQRSELCDTTVDSGMIRVTVAYTGLNYKDVMIAVGVLKEDAFGNGRTGVAIGLEASGVVEAIGPDVTDLKVGDRVFGILGNGIATHTVVEACFTCKKPDNISMPEAAAVFVPYTTAFATIVSIGHVSSGNTVLIHGAAGGVGSAAIQLAHAHGAVVIATVSNKKKEAYVRQLGADYVFDSRSCSFCSDVMNVTNHRGCDLILNCLSGRMMRESVRLLAPYGTFIEIGKTDAMSRRSICVHDMLENGTYILFDMDRYFEKRDICVGWIQGMCREIEKGVLRPPPYEIFTLKNIPFAIRRLSAAKHIGKIIVQLRDDDGQLLPSCRQLPFVPHTLFRGDLSYLLVGGTGGLGIHVADWLNTRGARHILLVSRSGTVNLQDKLVLNQMRQNGCDVTTVGADVCDPLAMTNCLDTYQTSHPAIVGVFHTAMVLRDGLITNLTADDIAVSVKVKAEGGWTLHNYFTSHHVDLDLFVVFSSISSIIGNMGQSNYCIGNCALEGLIHHRRQLVSEFSLCHTKGLNGTILNLAGVYDAGAVARDSSIINESLRIQMISYQDVNDTLEYVASQQSRLLSDEPTNQNDDETHVKTEPPRQLIIFPFAVGLPLLGDLHILKSLHFTLENSVAIAEKMSLKVAKLPAKERLEFVTHCIKSSIATILGLEETALRSDQPLSTLGIDSILAVELKNRIDHQWNMNIPVFELTSGKSVGDLIDTVLKHAEKAAGETGADCGIVQQEAKEEQMWTVQNILARKPIKPLEGKSVMPPSNGPNIEATVMANFNTMKAALEIRTDYAERFDWRTTREALETRVYLSQLPWNPYFFTQSKKTPTISDVDNYPNCINYTTYDYLGLCCSKEVTKAAQDALEVYGTSVSASRLAGGQIPLHNLLEKAVSEFLGVEEAIVMLGGHTCNVNTLKCLLNKKDLVLYDELAHNSIIEGAVYSGASRMAFRHNDWKDLERILSEYRCKFEKVMICIEGIYSMDGDIPDLLQFIRIKQRFNSILYVDEAHSIGVLGDHGRGIGEHFGIDPSLVDLWMGSLGKAFASAGGYIAGSSVVIQILRYRAPGFVYSIGMPPGNAAAALEAINQTLREPWRITKLRERTELFKKLCVERDIDIYDCQKHCSAVIPVKCGSTERCIEVMRRLRARGVLVSAGMYPAVETGNARLRFFISANHQIEEINITVDAISNVLEETKEM